MIMEAMQRVMAGRTTLMIAHRLSTLEVCDARIVIEHGHIVSAAGNIEHVSIAHPMGRVAT
jgi:ABC-type multidrug transport system fused ATPase/permease subunit